MQIHIQSYTVQALGKKKSVSSEVTHFLSLLFHENVALRSPVPAHFLSIFLASICREQELTPPTIHLPSL